MLLLGECPPGDAGRLPRVEADVRRWLILGLLFAGVCALPIARPPKPPIAEAAPPPAPAISGATVTQACSAAVPGASTVTLAWPKPGSGAQQTWFDISLVPGFAPGWFKGYGPLAVSQTAYAIDGVPQGLTYYYRVNTFYGGNTWKESASGTFVSNCGGGNGLPPSTIGVQQTCDAAGATVTVTFKWAANSAGSQWLDLSMQNNGFAPGTFVGAGPVPSGQGSFTWPGLAKGGTHYWRVNTLTATGWRSSDTGAFTTLSCVPPLKACVGFMKNITTTGRAECDVVISGPDPILSACIATILKVGGYANACVDYSLSEAPKPPHLASCLMHLAGQNRYGGGSCYNYYGSA